MICMQMQILHPRLVQMMEETLKKLYAHYCKQDIQKMKEESSSRQNVNSSGSDEVECQDILKKRMLKYKSFLKSGESGENTELDMYLKDAKESIDDSFDLLGWWKMNSTKYKVLSRIAKDVLAVPVSMFLFPRFLQNLLLVPEAEFWILIGAILLLKLCKRLFVHKTGYEMIFHKKGLT